MACCGVLTRRRYHHPWSGVIRDMFLTSVADLCDVQHYMLATFTTSIPVTAHSVIREVLFVPLGRTSLDNGSRARSFAYASA